MVEAAHEIFTQKTEDGAVGAAATAAAESPVALADHMDSFPLLPLPLIPRLSLADLRECERALRQLLASLSTSADDLQLAKYAGRQLSLVQRQAEQTRARERVLQLLRGDAPTLGVLPIESRGVCEHDTLESPRMHRNLKPVLRPRSGCRVAAVADTTAATPSTSAKSPLAKAAVKKRKDAIEAAKALIQANLKRSASGAANTSSQRSTSAASTSPFVITAGDHSNFKRRGQRKAKKKLTPAEQEHARAQQLEKERERRRHEAYQRLLARQELQASKKRKAEQHQREQHPATGDGAVLQKDVGDDSEPPERKDVSDPSGSSSRVDDSGSESDESEVSNCSDSDEANEKTIMALEVAPRTEEPRDEDDKKEEEVPGSEGSGDEGQDGSDPLESDEDDDGTDEAQHLLSAHAVSGDDHDKEQGARQEDDERPEVDDDVQERHELQTHREESADSTVQLSSSMETQQEQITRDLQTFISSRKAAMMEQLQRQKHEQRAVEASRPSTSEIVTSRDQQRNQCQSEAAHHDILDLRAKRESADGCLSDPDEQQSARSCQRESQVHRQIPDNAAAPAINTEETQQQHLQALSVVGVTEPSRRDVVVPRLLAKPCKDYRSYFSNFHCILTSVFEQRHAFRSTSSSREALIASSLPQAPPVHDQSLRIQLKLYEGWQSIMRDYATVFGGNIATPRSMLPSTSSGAPSTLSPFTAHYRINSTTRREVCDIVVTALDKLGDWDEHPSGLGLKTTWNLLWTWSKPRVERKTLLAWQKVNHFQHAKALTRKDCLKKNMGKYLAMGGRMKQAYSVVPLTFILPQEYIAFVQAFQDKGARLHRKWEESARDDGSRGASPAGKNIWIMKPVALSRGRGISLVNDLSQVVYGEQVVIQEYIANPLLLDGYKFDLRLYVLVTSFNPLEAFFYDEGFVRICTRQYEDSDLSNLFVHLTNSSIQKENQDAIQSR